jgi:hypothetical protein
LCHFRGQCFISFLAKGIMVLCPTHLIWEINFNLSVSCFSSFVTTVHRVWVSWMIGKDTWMMVECTSWRMNNISNMFFCCFSKLASYLILFSIYRQTQVWRIRVCFAPHPCVGSPAGYVCFSAHWHCWNYLVFSSSGTRKGAKLLTRCR